MEVISNHLIFPGKIVTIETVSVPIINGNVDATGTRWIDSANDDAPYAFILRLYTVQDSSAKETLGECIAQASQELFYDDYFNWINLTWQQTIQEYCRYFSNEFNSRNKKPRQTYKI